MKIFLDFDGTVVSHRYPVIGIPVEHAIRVLKRLQDKKVDIYLNTMRSQLSTHSLFNAVNYLSTNNIHVFHICDYKLTPTPPTETEFFIDDLPSAVCPMIQNVHLEYVVDWLKVEQELEHRNIL